MAVVRVKRRLQDDPQELLLVTCKKFKSEENPKAAVFTFAATVKDQDDISSQIKETIGSSSLLGTKQKTTESITCKLRLENKSISHNNRLKVVNCFRSLNEDADADNETKVGKTFTVLDMEDCSEPNPPRVLKSSFGPENNTESIKTSEYVYDLYYSPDPSDILIERIMSGHDVEFYFEKMEDECEEEFVPDDEDDSNDENNWRNDYPDEEDDSSESLEDEDGILKKLRKLRLGRNSDLSSDDGEEDMVYGIDDARDSYDYSQDGYESCEDGDKGCSDQSD